MKTFVFLFAVILGVFLILHLGLFIPSQRKKKSKVNLGDPTYWAMLTAFAIVLAAIGAEIYVRMPDQMAPWTWAGRVLVVLGAAWTIWTRKALGKNYAPTAENFDPEQALIKTGPYRFMRHPMYAGNIATVAGAILAFNLKYAWWSLVPFCLAIAWRIVAEERFMREKFGDDWQARIRQQRKDSMDAES